MDARQVMFCLIRSEICGAPLDVEELSSLSSEVLAELCSIADRQDMLHIVASALIKAGVLSENKKRRLEKKLLLAAYRYRMQENELSKICGALSEARIEHIPLKGSVIRELYPEPWQRTSCDVDVLVKKDELDAATAALTEALGYTMERIEEHDVSLTTESGVHVELHYDLIEDYMIEGAPPVLSRVWSTLCDGSGYTRRMSDGMFYFYHVAHMAKHFENGGCGVRPLLDLWLLDNRMDFDAKERDELLSEGGLLRFADAARRLSTVWFSGAEHEGVSRQMEDYIINGGVYGTKENGATVKQRKRGGPLGYALSRIFMPYHELRGYYSILFQHPWLYPFMQVRRWFRIVFCGGFKRSVRELNVNRKISKEQREATDAFMLEIGL